jgi:hypothetical protein
MPSTLTLAQARLELDGQSPAAELDARINLACERLVAMGKWRGLMDRLAVRISDGLFTLPMEYESCVAATLEGAPIQIRAPWYEFMQGGWGTPDITGYPVPIDRGLHAALRDVAVEPDKSDAEGVVFHLENLGDVTQVPGQPEGSGGPGPSETWPSFSLIGEGLPTEGSNSTYGEASRFNETVTITENDTGVETSTFAFTRITGLTKPRTLGRVFVLGADSGNLLAVMEPRDTRMSLHRYEVPLRSSAEAGDRVVVAFAKRAFRKAAEDDDLLAIDSVYALRNALIALQYEDEGDDKLSLTHWSLSRKHLDDALSEHRGSSSRVLPIYNRASGGHRLRSLR